MIHMGWRETVDDKDSGAVRRKGSLGSRTLGLTSDAVEALADDGRGYEGFDPTREPQKLESVDPNDPPGRAPTSFDQERVAAEQVVVLEQSRSKACAKRAKRQRESNKMFGGRTKGLIVVVATQSTEPAPPQTEGESPGLERNVH